MDINLQLMKRKGLRSDLARTVGVHSPPGYGEQSRDAPGISLLQEHPGMANALSPSPGKR